MLFPERTRQALVIFREHGMRVTYSSLSRVSMFKFCFDAYQLSKVMYSHVTPLRTIRYIRQRANWFFVRYRRPVTAACSAITAHAFLGISVFCQVVRSFKGSTIVSGSLAVKGASRGRIEGKRARNC